MSFLPINLDDLIHARSIESVRIEYKKTWNPVIMESAVRSICAYANDFFNLNGGYIIFGIEEDEGKPLLPPFGVDNIDWISCKRMFADNAIGLFRNISL